MRLELKITKLQSISCGMKENLISIRSRQNKPKLKRAICCWWMSLIPTEEINALPC